MTHILSVGALVRIDILPCDSFLLLHILHRIHMCSLSSGIERMVFFGSSSLGFHVSAQGPEMQGAQTHIQRALMLPLPSVAQGEGDGHIHNI